MRLGEKPADHGGDDRLHGRVPRCGGHFQSAMLRGGEIHRAGPLPCSLRLWHAGYPAEAVKHFQFIRNNIIEFP